MSTIKEIKKLFQESKYDKTLELIDKLDEGSRFEGNLIKSKIFSKQGDIKGAFTLLDSIIIAQTEKQEVLIFKSLIDRSSLHWQTGDYEMALADIKLAEEILQDLSQSQRSKVFRCQGDLYFVKGKILLSRGEIDQALKEQTKSLRIREIHNDKKAIASNLNIIGVIHIHMGKTNKAIMNFKKCLSIYNALNEIEDALYILNNLGGIYHSIGEPVKALYYLNKGLVQVKKSNSALKSKFLNNLGNVYSVRGNYKKAISYYEESLELKLEISNEHSLGISYFNIARIHKAEGTYDIALDYFKASLHIFRNIGNLIECSNVLVEIISYYLEINAAELAIKYFNELSKYKEQSQLPIINLYYEFAFANLHMKRSLIPYQIRAEYIFSMIITDKILNFEITMLSIINLIEIKLLNYKKFRAEGSIIRIRQLTNLLHEMASSHNSFTILVNTLILKSKLQGLLANFAYAQNLLDQAESIVKEKGLFGFTHKITQVNLMISEQQLNDSNRDENINTRKSMIAGIDFFNFHEQLREMVNTYV